MSKRYIDADALIKDLESRRLVFKNTISVADALRTQGRVMREAIEEAPTADVVEVVRCRDCEYSYTDKYDRLMCHIRNGSYNEECAPNDFCSYGERREE